MMIHAAAFPEVHFAFIPFAAQAAIQLAPTVLGWLGGRNKKRGPDTQGIIDRYRSSRPEAYVTEADRQQAERARTTMAGAAQNAAQQQRALNARSIRNRRLSGAAAAALGENANQMAAQGMESAARNSAGMLYQAGQSNLGYARRQNDTVFGAEMGQAARQQALDQARESEMWNSIMGVTEGISGLMGSYNKAHPAPKTS